jgi:hypothetical protein
MNYMLQGVKKQINQRFLDNGRISIDETESEMGSSHEKWEQKRLKTQLKICYSDGIGKYL